MKNALRSHFWTVVFALAFVVGMQPIAPMLGHWYNENTPVVDMEGVIVERTDESVLIHITGEKLRMCRYVAITAMTSTADGRLEDAYIRKMSGKPQDGSTKPVGNYDLGLWQVWPISGSSKVVVFVQHDCDGAVVLSKIAEVSL